MFGLKPNDPLPTCWGGRLRSRSERSRVGARVLTLQAQARILGAPARGVPQSAGRMETAPGALRPLEPDPASLQICARRWYAARLHLAARCREAPKDRVPIGRPHPRFS